MKEEHIIESVSDIIFEFLNNMSLDIDEVINYWGGDSSQELIFKGDDEEWK